MAFWNRKKQADASAQSAPRDSIENPNVPITAETVATMCSILSDAGIYVSSDTAKRSSAVYACVNVLAQSVATIPMRVCQHVNGAPQVVTKDDVAKMVTRRPNPYMKSLDWRDMIMNHLLLQGNHYAVILRKNSGRPIGLYPIFRPEQVRPFRKNSIVAYEVALLDGGTEIISADDMLHFVGPGFDGLKGYNPIQVLRNGVGITLAAEQHAAKQFENGAKMSGILVKKGAAMSPEAQARFMADWQKNFESSKNAGKTVLLQEEFDYKTVSINNADLQFLETRKFSVEDIARIFGVPPHMIGILEKTTFSSIEQQSINFVVHSLRPWLVRIEQEIDAKLFDDGDEMFTDFNVDGLLRGDFAARMTGYSTGLNCGLFTVNEARAKENLPKVEGGDELRVPVNTAPISADTTGAGDQTSADVAPAQDNSAD